MYYSFLLVVWFASRVAVALVVGCFDMRAKYLHSLFVSCFALLAGAGGSVAPQSSLHLTPQVETTEDILQAVAGAAMPTFGSGGALTPEQDYAEARRRMLDAEEVAIKRIVGNVLAR